MCSSCAQPLLNREPYLSLTSEWAPPTQPWVFFFFFFFNQSVRTTSVFRIVFSRGFWSAFISIGQFDSSRDHIWRKFLSRFACPNPESELLWDQLWDGAATHCLYVYCTTSTPVHTSQEEKTVGSLGGATSWRHDAQRVTSQVYYTRWFITCLMIDRGPWLQTAMLHLEYRHFRLYCLSAHDVRTQLTVGVSAGICTHRPAWHALQRRDETSRLCDNVHQQFSSPTIPLFAWGLYWTACSWLLLIGCTDRQAYHYPQ